MEMRTLINKMEDIRDSRQCSQERKTRVLCVTNINAKKHRNRMCHLIHFLYLVKQSTSKNIYFDSKHHILEFLSFLLLSIYFLGVKIFSTNSFHLLLLYKLHSFHAAVFTRAQIHYVRRSPA